MKNKYLFFTPILLLNLLLSQNWQPFHIDELSKYSNYEFNYSETDDYASTQVPQVNRNVLSHRIIGYLPYWEYSDYPDFDFNLLTEINFFSAELSPDGSIINDHNWNNLSIVSYAHERGVKVKLCATLFGQSELTTLLSDSLNRANAIENLLGLVINKNADGIDIDFELLPSSQRDNLVLFMQELSDAFHGEIEDPIITMATPAVDWSDAWDYNALAQITDGLFIMGYNYFYSGSQTAGPVSPLGGYFYDLDYTVQDYIEKTNGQLDKLILGLPYYGYDWPVETQFINSETTGSGSAILYSSAQGLSDYYTYNYDQPTESIWFPYMDTSWRQCWYDDSLSLSIKYQYAKDLNLNGVGIWALGYDNGDDRLWGALDDQFDVILGDLNQDGILNVIDIIVLVNIILDFEETQSNVDLNDDGDINILDVIYLLYLIVPDN